MAPGLGLMQRVPLEALWINAPDNQAMGCGWGVEFASIAIFSSCLLF